MDNLIKRLQNEKEYSFVRVLRLLEMWLEDVRQNSICYGSVKGLLYGLYAVGYITDKELDSLLDELISYK